MSAALKGAAVFVIVVLSVAFPWACLFYGPVAS